MSRHTQMNREVTRLVPPRTARDAPLVVTMSPEGLYFREFGRRKKYLLPFGIGKLVAVRLEVEAEKQRKVAERKARRAAKLT